MTGIRPTARILAVAGIALATVAVVALAWAIQPRPPASEPGATPAATASDTAPPGASAGGGAAASPPAFTPDPGPGAAPSAPPAAPPASGVVPTSVPVPAFSELPGPAQRTAWVPDETIHQVSYLVTADGSARVVYGAIGETQTTVDVSGDWRLDVDVPEADTTVRVSVTGTGATDVACEILVDGESAAQREAVGNSAQATCAANILELG